MKPNYAFYILILLVLVNCTRQTESISATSIVNQDSKIDIDSKRKQAILLKDSAVSLIHFKRSESYIEAMMLLDSSIATDTEFHIAYIEKTGLYCRMKQYDKAISLLKEILLKFEAMRPENQFLLGVIYQKTGDSTLALEQYKNAAASYSSRYLENGEILDLLSYAKATYVFDKNRGIEIIDSIINKALNPLLKMQIIEYKRVEMIESDHQQFIIELFEDF
jgi:tetratricopeptide (TPR) repeat protein